MPTTKWSLIAKLRDSDGQNAREALDELCRSYHYPIYCQMRRRGLAHHDAQDALHEFFLKLLRLDTFGLADSEKGRLRTFLMVALRRFLATWHHSEKRRESHEVSIEALQAIFGAEQRFQLDESAHHDSPDLLYDRQWVQEIMNHVLTRIRANYAAKGRERVFDGLRPVLVSGGSFGNHDIEGLSRALNMRPGALRTALHRLLEDYREELRKEILKTVENREMANQEFSELMDVFRKH